MATVTSAETATAAPMAPPSPKLRQARLLRMKLQLAYFKVKTNQTNTPLASLRLPGKAPEKPAKTTAKATAPSLLRNTRMDDVVSQKALDRVQHRSFRRASATSANVLEGRVSKLPIPSDGSRTRPPALSLKNSLLNSSMIPSALSAPAGILTFNASMKNINTNANVTANSNDNDNNNDNTNNRQEKRQLKFATTSSMTSPSKFAISSSASLKNQSSRAMSTLSSTSSTRCIRLPPVNKFLNLSNNTTENIFNLRNKSSFITVDPDQTIEERNADAHSHSTPNKTSRRHSFDTTIEQVEGDAETEVEADTDMTIQQHHSILHMSTPVRQRGSNAMNSQTRKITGSTTKLSTSRLSNTNTNINSESNKENIINTAHAHRGAADEETQIMSSPTRLMSTPSSIGAARCLLQLAYR